MLGTHLGTTAIACAAVDDVTAWCLLAVVVAHRQAPAAWAARCGPSASPCCSSSLMFCVVRPRSPRRPAAGDRRGPRAGAPRGGVRRSCFASALATELIGIHALFGAFLVGAMHAAGPRAARSCLRERLETFSSCFLLPLFFAFTGLRTQIGLLNDWQELADLRRDHRRGRSPGKLGGSMVAARSTGMSWRDSLSLGALMNTRGLMELIVLNIGYDLGILSPRIFTMLVMMALVTTFMTGPLVSLVGWMRQRQEDMGSPEVVT